MKEKLGPILVQLPAGVKLHHPNVEPFLKLLSRFRSWNFAIEARDDSWITEETKDILSERKLIWVISDSGGKYPFMEAVTADWVYLRLHGPARAYAGKYDKKALSFYAKKAKQWLSEGKEIWAFFDNDEKAYAVENAKTFRELI